MAKISEEVSKARANQKLNNELARELRLKKQLRDLRETGIIRPNHKRVRNENMQDT